MDNQDSYILPQYEQEGDNLLINLLNDSVNDKEMINSGDSTDLKGYYLDLADSIQQEVPTSNYKDILDKDQINCPLPENLYQEHGDQSILIITSSTKKDYYDFQTTLKKDFKIDKHAYQEETRQIKIQRYRQKKCRRIWDRKVFYDCRKVVADKRQRLNGRFVKKSPLLLEKSSNHKYSLATQQIQIPKGCQQNYLSKTDFTEFLLE